MFSDKKVYKMKNLRITVRVEPKDRQKIENLVEAGKFKNISQVIRAALRHFLSET